MHESVENTRYSRNILTFTLKSFLSAPQNDAESNPSRDHAPTQEKLAEQRSTTSDSNRAPFVPFVLDYDQSPQTSLEMTLLVEFGAREIIRAFKKREHPSPLCT